MCFRVLCLSWGGFGRGVMGMLMIFPKLRTTILLLRCCSWRFWSPTCFVFVLQCFGRVSRRKEKKLDCKRITEFVFDCVLILMWACSDLTADLLRLDSFNGCRLYRDVALATL